MLNRIEVVGNFKKFICEYQIFKDSEYEIICRCSPFLENTKYLVIKNSKEIFSTQFLDSAIIYYNDLGEK